MRTRICKYLTRIGIALPVFFSFTGRAFAIDPTPTPTPTETVPVVIPPTDVVVVNPYNLVVSLDPDQFVPLLAVLCLLLVFTIATFTIKVSAPFSLRRKK